MRVNAMCTRAQSLSHVHLSATHRLWPARLLCPWGFSRQECWSGLPWPPPGDLSNPGIKPRSPTLQVDSLPSEPPTTPSVQFSSVAQSHPALCHPMNCSTPGLPVHHHLQEFTQTQRPSSWRCHPAISSSVVPFSSCPQSLPAPTPGVHPDSRPLSQ